MEEVDPFRDPALYSYEPIPLMKLGKRYFRALDIYALPITLRYKMEKKFYTNFGALASVILLLVVGVFIYLEVSLMISKTEVTGTSQSNFINSRSSDVHPQTFVPFSFGFRIRTTTTNQIFSDDTYLNVSLNQVSNLWDENSQSYTQVQTPLQLVSCTDSSVFDFASSSA